MRLAGDGVMETQDLPREKQQLELLFSLATRAMPLMGVPALTTLIRVIGKTCQEARTIPPYCSYHSLEKIGKRWRPGEEGHRINLRRLPAQLSPPRPATLPLRLLLPSSRGLYLPSHYFDSAASGFLSKRRRSPVLPLLLPPEPSGRGCRPY